MDKPFLVLLENRGTVTLIPVGAGETHITTDLKIHINSSAKKWSLQELRSSAMGGQKHSFQPSDNGRFYRLDRRRNGSRVTVIDRNEKKKSEKYLLDILNTGYASG